MTVREVPLLDADQPVAAAARRVVESGMPALPVVEAGGRLLGVFGEREFMQALFPGYVGELRSAHFVTHSLDEALERRAACRDEPVREHANLERIAVGADFSEVELAETFLHHRVLIVPVVEAGVVRGVIARADFFRELVERFEASG